jgi:hypothetical protein
MSMKVILLDVKAHITKVSCSERSVGAWLKESAITPRQLGLGAAFASGRAVVHAGLAALAHIVGAVLETHRGRVGGIDAAKGSK